MTIDAEFGTAQFRDRLRLPLAVDASALAADLGRLEGLDWTMHFVPQNFSGEWSVLPLRAPLGAGHPILRITSNPECDTWEDTEILALCPAITGFLATLHCPLGAVRLMRLTPGSAIKEHSDPDLSAEGGVARLHVPIATNAQVDFRVNRKRVDMVAGECWYVRLSDPHSVTNQGKTDRVHLVIDATVNAWLSSVLSAAAIASNP
jgi:hypothetical protein